jgi:tetratricopeptide (TPR) repeat protein
LYELLTLEPAFPQAKSRAVKPDSTTPIRDVKSWNPHVPRDLRTITMKACSLEPSDRYQTAAALEEDLRRFLDDRPILARRISSLESLWRWSRRNPLLASLTTLVLGLLASMVVMLSVWNQQATDDLRRIQTENRRAEQNLLEKTSALQLAQQEQTRAEKNLQLAVDAFDAVIQNISARGAESWNWSEVDDEDLLEFPEASLTGADVVLLETLLKFFDRFSAENSQQLLEQTAFARRRVGDLQKHLGRYVDAEASYQQAANAYRELGNQEPGKTTWIIAQAEVLLEQQWLASQRRELARALKYYEQARTLIEGNSVTRNSLEGRFALAKVLSTFASFSPRQIRDLRLRPPVESVRKQGTVNQEAIQLLTGLSQEHPEVVAYRVTLARALKNDMRLASGLQDPDRAESALQEAVKIMDGLIQQYPDVPTYQFELAEILCTNLAPRPRDQGRFLRAKGLAEELVRDHPQNHKYKSLLASVLSRMALMQWHSNRFESGERTLNEVIEMQQALAEDVPEMVAYQVQYLQSLRMLAGWQKSQKRFDESKQTLGTAVKAAEKFAEQGKSRNPIKELLQNLRTE